MNKVKVVVLMSLVAGVGQSQAADSSKAMTVREWTKGVAKNVSGAVTSVPGKASLLAARVEGRLGYGLPADIKNTVADLAANLGSKEAEDFANRMSDKITSPSAVVAELKSTDVRATRNLLLNNADIRAELTAAIESKNEAVDALMLQVANSDVYLQELAAQDPVFAKLLADRLAKHTVASQVAIQLTQAEVSVQAPAAQAEASAAPAAQEVVAQAEVSVQAPAAQTEAPATQGVVAQAEVSVQAPAVEEASVPAAQTEAPAVEATQEVVAQAEVSVQAPAAEEASVPAAQTEAPAVEVTQEVVAQAEVSVQAPAAQAEASAAPAAQEVVAQAEVSVQAPAAQTEAPAAPATTQDASAAAEGSL